jgi:hypothetical protein
VQLRKLAFALVVLAASASAHAVGLGLRVGTTGLGMDLGFGLTDSLALRIGYAGADFNRSFDEQDIRYDAKLKWSNASLLVDWHILGTFRLTGGIVNANNRVDATGTPTGGTFTINDTPYPASDIGTLNGTTRLGKSATPYLGIGFGNLGTPGFSFYGDLGVMFMGTPTVSLTGTCGPSLPAPQCAQLQADIAAEEQRINDDIKDYKYFPVLNLGLAYTF